MEGDQIDMEIRIPIDQEIPSVGKYFYKAKMKELINFKTKNVVTKNNERVTQLSYLSVAKKI